MTCENTCMNIPLAPVYDVYVDLKRLAALANTLAYLTSEQNLKDENNQIIILNDVFLELSERLTIAHTELESALSWLPEVA